MQTQLATEGLIVVIGGGAGLSAWYLYQIGVRKQQWIRYKIRRTVFGLLVYTVAAIILIRQGLPALEAAILAALSGMGLTWLLLSPPKRNRRIPRSTWRAVIERDLTSKGLKWDPSKYHVDHKVPFSRGGDNSLRNLEVVPKDRNLRKGGKMPGLRDFLRK